MSDGSGKKSKSKKQEERETDSQCDKRKTKRRFRRKTPKYEARILMIGLDAGGKTSILFKEIECMLL